MRRVLFVSDYVEGLPVIASVRYEQLMRRISRRFEVCVASSSLYGDSTSLAGEHLLYSSVASRYTNKFKGAKTSIGRLEATLRGSKVFKKAWKRCQKSPLLFRLKNRDFARQLRESIDKNPPDAVIVTVPELEALYAALLIKKLFPHIPLICEMRDILDSDIWKDRAKGVVRRAERKLMESANGVIALSDGIAGHYSPMLREGAPLEIIRNGYDEEELEGVSCQNPVRLNSGYLVAKGRLSLIHTGSIYEGRNIGDLLMGLAIFAEMSGAGVSLDIVGHVDAKGMQEIELFKSGCAGVDVRFHGSVSHEEALKRLLESDAAVIITHRSGSEYALPGKLFEYIGACKPVLAVSTDAELVSLVEGRFGECAGHSPQEVAAAVERLTQGSYDFSGREAYSRSIQAQRVIDFIERVVESSKA